MLYRPSNQERLNRLADELHGAPAVTPELVSDVIACVCARLPAHIESKIEACAWTDLALALVELELPAWKVRRLVYEDGEWLCSLSRQPSLPVELDDSVDATHEVLALAILSALVEARRGTQAHEPSSTAVPQVRPTVGHAVCCDNFA